MNYSKIILNELLDKLDKRQVKYGGVSVSRKISLENREDVDVFSKYWGDDAYLYRDEIDGAIKQLEKLGFVQAIYDRATSFLIKVVLVEEHASEAFSYVGRIPEAVRIAGDIKNGRKLLKTLQKSTTSYSFLQKMLDNLQSGKSCKQYFKSYGELEEIVTAVKMIEENDEEILLRNFSKKKFKDSKFLERIGAKLLKIFNTFGGEVFSSFHELCERYLIVRDTGYAIVKHGLRLLINQQEIDLDALGIDFCLSDSAIEQMKIMQVTRRKVITIENLTTFHYFDSKDAIVIYLGGYHNAVKRKFLKKLSAFDSRLDWFHFGDIDWGGFEIFMDLTRKTGINFHPIMMSIDELRTYRSECAPLTSEDRQRLQRLLNDKDAAIFYSTIEFMLKNGYKLEQESVVMKRF